MSEHTCINTVNPMFGSPACEACASAPRCVHGWNETACKSPCPQCVVIGERDAALAMLRRVVGAHDAFVAADDATSANRADAEQEAALADARKLLGGG